MDTKHLAKKIILYLVIVAAGFLVLVSFASLAYDTGFWFMQILNFPRLQTFLLLLLFLVVYLTVSKARSTKHWIFIGSMVVAIIIQAYILFPYFPLASKSIPSAEDKEANADNTFSLLLANVYMKNREMKKLVEMIEKYQPSIIITMEVNDWWAAQLKPISNNYPHVISYPTDNTYGMILYSKLPLQGSQIRFLNHDSVPSFYTTAVLPNGKTFRLVGIHPVAPKPSQHPDNVNEDEVALVKAGHIVKPYTEPTIVAGDFNDVGWSHNSNHFEEISGLRDVRNGRGLYNTFNAKSFIFRWPLDYVYTSSQFKVVSIERLEAFGSDHFPFYVKLALP